MPRSLDAGDRKLLIGAGALLVVLLVVTTLLSPGETGAGGSSYPSSYSADWDGAKGAYLLLQDLGYKIVRWQRSPLDLSDQAATQVLILAQPLQSPSPEEKLAIVQFLRRGGRVVATGRGAAPLLPDAPPLTEGFPFDEPAKFQPLLPSPLMRDAPEIRMIPPQHWQPNSSSQLVIYGNEQTAAVIAYSVGKGQVIWWGASTPLTNGGIRDSGNLALLLNSVGSPQGINVLWDEYFHGAHGSLWSYLGRTPLAWGVVQFGIVFLAILATYSRRQEPVRLPLKTSRLSPLEFVETLGDLYSSAHAGSTAVRIANQRLRFQLTRQLGLSATAADAELVHAAGKALAWNEEEFSATLARAARAANTAKSSDAHTLKLVQEIFDYASRLELRRPRPTERQPA